MRPCPGASALLCTLRSLVASVGKATPANGVVAALAKRQTKPAGLALFSGRPPAGAGQTLGCLDCPCLGWWMRRRQMRARPRGSGAVDEQGRSFAELAVEQGLVTAEPGAAARLPDTLVAKAQAARR